MEEMPDLAGVIWERIELSLSTAMICDVEVMIIESVRGSKSD
jgi:hypothetical protein